MLYIESPHWNCSNDARMSLAAAAAPAPAAEVQAASAPHECEYCRDGRPHPLFVCLLTNRKHVNNPIQHTTLSWVGVTSNPLCYVLCQNRDPRFIPGSQLTKAGAPDYQVELACGPFHPVTPADEHAVADAPRARVMRRSCRAASRKLVNRICFFAEYAQRLHRRHAEISLYVRDRALVTRYLSQAKKRPKQNK